MIDRSHYRVDIKRTIVKNLFILKVFISISRSAVAAFWSWHHFLKYMTATATVRQFCLMRHSSSSVTNQDSMSWNFESYDKWFNTVLPSLVEDKNLLLSLTWSDFYLTWAVILCSPKHWNWTLKSLSSVILEEETLLDVFDYTFTFRC